MRLLPEVTGRQLLITLGMLLLALAAVSILPLFRRAPAPEIAVLTRVTAPEATGVTAVAPDETIADQLDEISPTLAAVTATVAPTSTATPRPVPSPTPFSVVLPSPLPTAITLPSPTLPPTARVETAFNGVRAGPSTSYSLLERSVEIGTELVITGRSTDGEWWQVCCIEGQSGWLSGVEVQTEGDVAAVPIVPAPLPQAFVLVLALNIRTGPGLDYPVVATSALDTRFDVVARMSDSVWWQVCCVDGDTGWVFGDAVSIVGSTEFVPVVTDFPLAPTAEP